MKKHRSPASLLLSMVIMWSITLLSVIFFCNFTNQLKKPKEPEQIFITKRPIEIKKTEVKKQIKNQKSEVEGKIKEELAIHFAPDEQKIALAIIKQESSMNVLAKNYNCLYDSFGTINGISKPVKSKSCKKGDEKYAKSIDCGIIQRNYKGTSVCPIETKSLSWNIQEMKKLHDKHGWKDWVAYTSGRYKAYL